MIDTIEKLKELCDRTGSTDVPVISYREWLSCFSSLIDKIRNDDRSFDYHGVGSLIRFVEVADLSVQDEHDYDAYNEVLKNFFRAYSYAKSLDFNASPNEVYKSVLSGTAKYGDRPEYRPLS